MKVDEDKIRYCRKLYIEQNGKCHYLIEKSMREIGYSFSTRCLYRSGQRPGWIVKYGFRESLSEPPVSVGGSHADSGPILSVPPADRGSREGSPSGVVEAGGLTLASDSLDVDTGGNTTCRECASGRELAADHTDNTDQKTKNPRSSLSSSSAANNSFESWLKATSPQFHWDWPYQKYLYKKLEDVTSGKTKRLMIFMPPRHGKSELVTVRYAAWRLQRDRDMNIIVGSYNQKLANRFSRKIKNVLSDASALRSVPPAIAGGSTSARANTAANGSVPGAVATGAFSSAVRCQRQHQPPATAGGTDIAVRTINTVEEWDTRTGNSVRAVGVGAGITGYGA